MLFRSHTLSLTPFVMVLVWITGEDVYRKQQPLSWGVLQHLFSASPPRRVFLSLSSCPVRPRCILGELFTKKPIFQANQELAQLELIRYVTSGMRRGRERRFETSPLRQGCCWSRALTLTLFPRTPRCVDASSLLPSQPHLWQPLPRRVARRHQAALLQHHETKEAVPPTPTGGVCFVSFATRARRGIRPTRRPRLCVSVLLLGVR